MNNSDCGLSMFTAFLEWKLYILKQMQSKRSKIMKSEVTLTWSKPRITANLTYYLLFTSSVRNKISRLKQLLDQWIGAAL